MGQQPEEQRPSVPKQPMLSDHDDYDLSQPMIQELKGTLPGRERVRIVYRDNPDFRRIKDGVLEATEAAEIAPTAWGRVGQALKRMGIGEPLPIAQAEHERLSKFKALALLSPDAISSLAY